MPKPGSQAWWGRVATLEAGEAAAPKRLFYLSFADDPPVGFLGAVVIETQGPTTAMRETHRLGINPGGQMLAIEIPPGMDPPMECWNRLLTRAEVEKYIGKAKTIGEYEQEPQPKKKGNRGIK